VLSVGPGNWRSLDTTYLVGPGEPKAALFPAKRVANLGCSDLLAGWIVPGFSRRLLKLRQAAFSGKRRVKASELVRQARHLAGQIVAELLCSYGSIPSRGSRRQPLREKDDQSVMINLLTVDLSF
jgi:hypothetical protein